MTDPTVYHVRPDGDGYRKGYGLFTEYRDELYRVAPGQLFDTEAQAWAYAAECEAEDAEELASRDEDPNNTFPDDFAGFAENH